MDRSIYKDIKDKKINYHSEDYNSVIFNIALYLIFIILILIWGIFSFNKNISVGKIFFYSTLIIFLSILLFFSVKSYKSRKNKRYLNLFIIKNGKKIKGKIISISDNYISRMELDRKRLHNINAKINYNVNNEDKLVIVDELCIKRKKLKKFENKTVNIYIYNNMSYIDVIN